MLVCHKFKNCIHLLLQGKILERERPRRRRQALADPTDLPVQRPVHHHRVGVTAVVECVFGAALQRVLRGLGGAPRGAGRDGRSGGDELRRECVDPLGHSGGVAGMIYLVIKVFKILLYL